MFAMSAVGFSAVWTPAASAVASRVTWVLKAEAARWIRAASASLSDVTRSERAVSALTRTDPDHVLDRNRPHLAVADLSGLGRLDDHVDNVVGVVILDEHLNPDLGYEIDLVLRPAVHLSVP